MTRDELDRLLGYNDELGQECPLLWKVDRSRIRSGDPLSWCLMNGYATTKIYFAEVGQSKYYAVHRLVCLMNSTDYLSLDQLPQVDHIDRNRTNNLATNLRPVSRAQNARHSAIIRGSSQYRGVIYIGLRNKKNPWQASVTIGGSRCKHIGTFRTEIEAARGYDQFLIDRLGREGVLRECFSLNFPLEHGIEEGPTGVPQIIENWQVPPKPQLEMEVPSAQGQYGVYVIKPSGKRLSKDRQLELW